ncbi:hypothetical protein LWF15_32395 [Kineosporia rhizophila]|uniref:hypothetical protein n=1 Tax=Kineosporia TaxID=49184 RepID=UPI001E2FD560|nr:MULTISPECIES: hypothetical protein [Kineosporia]MCE0540204.1 hypothetical protein [Kineosporia rhizophila]GLY17245.1 hypothetical protein Kisp01_42600 [Kineosporia sp. NBRC 101677]
MTSARPSETDTPSDDPDHRPARTTKVLLAVGTVVVLGAVAWGASAFIGNSSASDQAAPKNTGGPLPWRVEGSPQPGEDGENPAAIDRPVVLFDGPVTIGAGLGLDLDQLKSEKTGSAQDVFWSQRNGLSKTEGRLYIDQGLPAGAAERCAAQVAADREGYPSLDVFPGDQFCLNTSEGRIAWLRVGEGADKDDELAVQVTVWDGVPG